MSHANFYFWYRNVNIVGKFILSLSHKQIVEQMIVKIKNKVDNCWINFRNGQKMLKNWKEHKYVQEVLEVYEVYEVWDFLNIIAPFSYFYFQRIFFKFS